MVLSLKERNVRAKTLDKISRSQHVIPSSKNVNLHDKILYKAISHKKISSETELSKSDKHRHLRSQTIGHYNISMQNPYEKFVKQLAIVLPTPKQKFYEFMEVHPFNRTLHHLQLIGHFLKGYKFFKNHPIQILMQISKKAKISTPRQINQKLIIVVDTGECFYNKDHYIRGDIIGRKELKVENLSCTPETKFITINRHEYKYLVSTYLESEKEKFKNFLTGIQIFKMFPKKAFDKFLQNLSLNFFTSGQYLYRFGDQATKLFIVFKGKASRKVIVEVDKMNKIPMLKYSKIVKILSKSYEHKIQFSTQDLIGIAQVIDHIQTRKENIKIEENSVILGLDKNIFQQNLDQYIIDRLRKYNLKKYPVTYDKLCEKFEKDQISVRQQEMRKIQALKSSITHQISQKKSQKIHQIIKKYQENIKKSQVMNLLQCKIQQRKVQRQ